MEANLSFGYVMVPKNNQKIIQIQHRLHLERTITIGENKKKNIPENVSSQGYFTKVSSDNQEENQQSDFKILW